MVAILSGVASLAAIAWVLSRGGVDPMEALSAVAPGTHLLLLLVALTEVAARGVRVAAVARGLGERVPVALSIRAQLAGDALAAVTPLRAGADPAKLTVFNRAGIRLGASGALLLGEMVSEALVLLATSAMLALLVDQGRWVSLGLLGYASVVLSAWGLALLLSRAPRDEPPLVWRLLRLSAERWTGIRATAALFRQRRAPGCCGYPHAGRPSSWWPRSCIWPAGSRCSRCW